MEELNEALRFIENAKTLIETCETMTDYNKPYRTCSLISRSVGIHLAEGIEKLAIALGIRELKIRYYDGDKEPFEKQFIYAGISFFQLFSICEKADIIRSGAKTIQL